MKSEWNWLPFSNAPIEIIDGDRGVNYPQQHEFTALDHCLFLNAGNVTTGGFDFSNCSFVSQEKDKTLRKGKLCRNDVVLTTRGTVGNVAFYNAVTPFDHIRINSGMVIVRATEGLLPKYLYLFLRSSAFKEQVATLLTGSAQPQLPIRDINRIEIPVPPAAEQKAIARILSSLDDKIELNRRMNETLEAMAQTLFRAWFVNFEPVKAKAAGLAPVGMDEATAALFPAEFEDSELGLIPKGWRVKRLEEAFEINPTRRLTRNQEATYLDMANVPTQGHRPTGWIYRDFGSGMKFINGDTLLARITPCLENGKTAFVDFLKSDEVGWGSTEFIVLRPLQPLPEYFGYLLCRHEDFRAYAIQSMTGTSGRQRVQTGSLGQYPLCVPPEPICRAFADLVQPLVSLIAHNSDQSRTLAQTRDALLPRLMAGQLRVTDAEALGTTPEAVAP